MQHLESAAYRDERTSPRPRVVIRAERAVPIGVAELWAYRDLALFLAWRDIRIRYSQTLLGVAWAVLQPMLSVAVFAVLFGSLAKVPSDGVPYPAFALCGLLPWQLFAAVIAATSNSVVDNQQFVTKVYFPRLLLPIAAVLPALVDFGITLLVLVTMLGYYGVHPTTAWLMVPVLALASALTAFGVGLWASALNIRYRDVKHALPFFVQLWFFVTPVAYPVGLVPERWRGLYALNPMVGLIDAFRACLLGTPAPRDGAFLSAIAVVALIVSGLAYFRSVEREFADLA